MASPRYSKDKGRAWENAIVEFLDTLGVPGVERRRLAGSQDKGDISGIRGVMIEAKNERGWKIPEWLREVDRQMRNAKAPVGVVWARVMGKPKAGDGVIIMHPHTFLGLLEAAGYLKLDQAPDDGVSSSEPL